MSLGKSLSIDSGEASRDIVMLSLFLVRFYALAAGHIFYLPTEVSDGPGKVMVNILLLVSVAPAGCLYLGLLRCRQSFFFVLPGASPSELNLTDCLEFECHH